MGAHEKKTEDTEDIKQEEELPVYEVNAARMRKNMKVAIVVLLVFVAAMGACFYFLTVNSDNISTQQTATSNADVTNISSSSSSSSSDNQKSTSVPALSTLVGTNIDAAAEVIGHGAQVTSDETKNEENNAIKRVVRFTLTSDGGDSKSGIPTVVVNVGENSNIISVEYSAATKSLGYGTVSFRDALNNEHIVENTLKEAGVNVVEGSARLGDDVAASEYTTYASDGIKTTREERTFDGEVDGVKWQARLVYDYSIGNATDNLSDTVRTIWFSISH